MGGTSEKTTSSRSDTMKGLFTAINKAKFPFSNDAGKKSLSKNTTSGFKLNNESVQKAKQKVTKITIAAGQGVKSGAVYLGNAIDEAKNEVDCKSLRPVFKDTLDQTTSNDPPSRISLYCRA